MKDSTPTKAVLWTNGMLMVFDQHGQQVPEYQGVGTECLPRLRADFPDCPVEGHDWRSEMRG